MLYKLCIILFLLVNLDAKNTIIESQPEIIFNYDKLKRYQDKLTLQVKFNKAILLLNKEKYKEAIKILDETSIFLRVPSNLNMGIAYYKLGQIDNAVINLNKVYNSKRAIKRNTYSYMSACFYLYKISKDTKYLDIIVKIATKYKKLSEHSKKMLADTYIILKEYNKALRILNSMDFALDLKKALLHMKLKDYKQAEVALVKAKENTVNNDTLDKILWVMIYRDLKTNDLDKLYENLDLIQKRKSTFKTNTQMPLEIYFNKDKYSSKEYMNFVLNFDEKRKIDFAYYFAPFIFSDKYEILYDSMKGFIFDTKDSIKSLDEMLSYNAAFINIIKDDPIIRVNKLKSLIKGDTRSYVYYNLGLCYAQIADYHSAFNYFEKAYRLNPGNKLYSSMTLITAKRLKRKIKDEDYISSNLKSNKGLYKDFGLNLYKQFLSPTFKIKKTNKKYENTIFFKALDYLEKVDEKKDLTNHILLKEYKKDPYIYLINLVQRRKNEDNYTYYSRLQDTIPLSLNNNFLEGPLIISKYYLEILKALGLFYKADIYIAGKKTPSYLRTKALTNLYFNNPDETIKTLEYLQEEYKLEDRYNMYMMVAALLQAGRYNDASVQISLIKAILNDKGADFLTAVQLIQDLTFISAKQYIKEPYTDLLIDFRLIGLDEFLESL